MSLLKPLSSPPYPTKKWFRTVEIWDGKPKQRWRPASSDSYLFTTLNFLLKMEHIRHLEPWLGSWSFWLDPVYIFSNATAKFNELKEDVVDLWRTDDWQIRLSWFLLICTALNFVFIGIAWNIYSESISNMFFNKARSPVHQRSKTKVLSSSMEDLIVKKIQ